jgi:hypothetical protein
MAGWPYKRRRLGHAHPALRPVRVTCRLFPLVTALPSTCSAAQLGALFAGFFGTVQGSVFATRPCRHTAHSAAFPVCACAQRRSGGRG